MSPGYRPRRRRCGGCGRLVDVLDTRFIGDDRGRLHRVTQCMGCWARREDALRRAGPTAR